jgi:hypothetical protein
MEAVAERLREAGCTRWTLNVKVGNTPAIHLYERFGMRNAYRSTALSLPWEGVARLPRDGAPVTARLIQPAEDPAIDAAFAFPPGRIADLRTLGRVLMRLVDPADPADPTVGVASFAPAFPGCYPFAVARPALAAPLLDALRPHARPADTHISLVCERDPELIAAVRAAGARVVHELIHMEGDIPA